MTDDGYEIGPVKPAGRSPLLPLPRCPLRSTASIVAAFLLITIGPGLAQEKPQVRPSGVNQQPAGRDGGPPQAPSTAALTIREQLVFGTPGVAVGTDAQGKPVAILRLPTLQAVRGATTTVDEVGTPGTGGVIVAQVTTTLPAGHLVAPAVRPGAREPRGQLDVPLGALDGDHYFVRIDGRCSPCGQPPGRVEPLAGFALRRRAGGLEVVMPPWRKVSVTATAERAQPPLRWLLRFEQLALPGAGWWIEVDRVQFGGGAGPDAVYLTMRHKRSAEGDCRFVDAELGRWNAGDFPAGTHPTMVWLREAPNPGDGDAWRPIALCVIDVRNPPR